MVTVPKLCVITPIFNEEEGLEHYVESVKKVILSRDDFVTQVIFVDDGSTDSSWSIIERICAEDAHFTGLRLSRNFGSHIAISAGIDATQDADMVCTLACDLQDPTETILEFIEKWKNGAQIVWGKRQTRQDSSWKIVASDFFTKLLARYAMPKNSLFCTGSFLLMDKIVVDAFKSFQEQHRITFALVAWTGFSQDTVLYNRQARHTGASGWTLAKMFKSMYDAFIGFSLLPIKLITSIAIVFFIIDLVAIIYLIWSWLWFDVVSGWTSIMVIMLFCFGLLFLMLGIMGEYLARIYGEVSGRPLYFIQSRTNDIK